MALPSFATVADVEVLLGLTPGTITGTDLARCERSLKYASMLVRRVAKRPWVDELGDLDPATPDELAEITARAAKRDYSNPDGVSNEALGQGAYSYTYASGMSVVYLTDDEVRLIVFVSGPGPTGWSGTGSIRTPSAYEHGILPEAMEHTDPRLWWEFPMNPWW
jgi:hypothetical protein